MASETPARPHVLTLTDRIGDGGAERIATELTLGLDGARFRRSVCVTRPTFRYPGDAAEVDYRRLEHAGVEVILLNRRNRYDLTPLRRLVAYVRAERVDVIHAHKFGSNVWAAVVGRALGIPVIIAHEHTWSFEGQPVRRLLDRHLVSRYADAVIAVSDADRRRMVATVGMSPDKVVLVPNGILWTSRGDAAAVRGELGIEPGEPVLAMIAVLRPQKAIHVMLEALRLLTERHAAVRLLVAGPGDQRELRRTAVELGVAAAVNFLGPRVDVPDILAAADVGVLSSDFEGLPLAALEYMAAGLPVVATRVGGLPQVVEPERTGILVPRRDPPALAEAIGRLLADPQLARSMGEAGRARQQQEFSREAMARRVTGLYESLMERKGVIHRGAAPSVDASAEAA